MAAESAVCGLASLYAVQVYRPVQREGRIPLHSILAISLLKREALKTNPAYGRHQLFRLMRIVGPIQI